jgi:hypothetical protein
LITLAVLVIGSGALFPSVGCQITWISLGGAMNFEAVATRPEKQDALLPPAPPKMSIKGSISSTASSGAEGST